MHLCLFKLYPERSESLNPLGNAVHTIDQILPVCWGAQTLRYGVVAHPQNHTSACPRRLSAGKTDAVSQAQPVSAETERKPEGSRSSSVLTLAADSSSELTELAVAFLWKLMNDSK